MLFKRIQNAAEATRDIAQRHEFRRLGIVSFGGAIVKDFAKSATIILDSLLSLGSDYKLLGSKRMPKSSRSCEKFLHPTPKLP